MVARVPWPVALSMASVAPLAAASALLNGSPSPSPAALGFAAPPLAGLGTRRVLPAHRHARTRIGDGDVQRTAPS